jgi:hypothetical protein
MKMGRRVGIGDLKKIGSFQLNDFMVGQCPNPEPNH